MEMANPRKEWSTPTVKIGFDDDWEARNWYDTINGQAKYGLRGGGNKWDPGDIPPDVLVLLDQAAGDKEAALELIRERIRAYLKEPGVEKLMGDIVQQAKMRWTQVGERYFDLLSKMLDVPAEQFEPVYHAYFTFSTRAPFGNHEFMFTRFLDFADNAMHEIMHIEFLKAHEQYCLDRGLTEDQIQHFKEMLTILLNEDMGGLLAKPDRGYSKHQEMRPKLLELYRANGGWQGDFHQFLDRAIELMRDWSPGG